MEEKRDDTKDGEAQWTTAGSPDGSVKIYPPTAAPGAKELVPEAMLCPSCGSVIFRGDFAAIGCQCGARPKPEAREVAPAAKMHELNNSKIPAAPGAKDGGSEASQAVRDDDPHICPTCGNTCRITHTNSACLPAPALDAGNVAPEDWNAYYRADRRDSAEPDLGGPKPGHMPTHSALLEMIGLADAGRCMACAGPLWNTGQSGCHGDCVVKFAERHPEYFKWKQRVQILALARKYLAGELGNAAGEER
jgi:hypothetical protein